MDKVRYTSTNKIKYGNAAAGATAHTITSPAECKCIQHGTVANPIVVAQHIRYIFAVAMCSFSLN
jgi:hypothetical protein